MRIITKDGKRSVDIGSSDIWIAIYSTAVDAFSGFKKRKISLAIKFMEDGSCSGEDGYEIARQFNLIRDELSTIEPEKVVYDINDRKKKAPWTGKISPVITSCANLFTTADGKDLLYEVVSILCYAQIAKTDVIIE
jgi:hypothetical protein